MDTIVEHINSAGRIFVEFALPMLIQSSVLIAILLLVDLLLRKKVKAVFRYWIWMLVLLKLILPTSLSSPLSLGYLFGDKLTYQDLAQTSPILEPTEPAPADISSGMDPLFIQPNPYIPPTEPVISVFEPAIAEPVSPPQVPVTPLSWQGVVLLVWLAVAIAMGLLLLQRALFVRGLVAQAKKAGCLMNDALAYCCASMGIKSKVGLKVSVNATTPSVCGLIRPVILVPWKLTSTLGASRLRTILMHELAHIRRGDLWVNLAQTALQIIYFYNPLFWLANSVIRRIREQAVDEAVLVAMGEKARKYPQTLVDVAKMTFKRPALSLRLIGVVESKSALAGRIKHILGRPIPKTAKLGIIGLLAVVIAGAILLPMARAQRLEFASQGGPLDIRLSGVQPDGSDDVYDGSGNKIAENSFANIANEWGEGQQHRTFIFELPKTDEPILFSPFLKIKPAGAKRGFGTGQHPLLYDSAGKLTYSVGVSFPRTYKKVIKRRVRQVDLTLRYYYGQRGAADFVFTGPFTVGKTVKADREADCELTATKDRLEVSNDPAVLFRISSKTRFYSNSVLVYDTSGRRYLPESRGGGSGKYGTSCHFYVEDLALNSIAYVTVGEKPYEAAFKNVVVSYPGRPVPERLEFLDEMCQRLDLNGFSGDLLNNYNFENPADAIKVIDIVRGLPYVMKVFRAIRYSDSGIELSNLDMQAQQKVRSAAAGWAKAGHPKVREMGIRLGLVGGWPEFMDMALEWLEQDVIVYDMLGRTYRGLEEGAKEQIAGEVANYPIALNSEQAERLKKIILSTDSPRLGMRLFQFFWRADEDLIFQICWDLVQDDRPWIWWPAMYSLSNRCNKKLRPFENLAEKMQKRLILVHKAGGGSSRLFDVSNSGKDYETVAKEAYAMLPAMFTAQLARMNSSTCHNVRQVMAKHLDREITTKAMTDFLREISTGPNQRLWAGDSYYFGICCSTSFYIALHINSLYDVNIENLGKYETRENYGDIPRNISRLKQLIARTLQWYDGRSGAGNESGIAVEVGTTDKAEAQTAPLDHFVGKYAMTGHPDTAAFEITKKGDVFIFRDLGGPKFEMDLLLRGLGGRKFEMEKGRDNLRFGDNPRYRFRVRYDASENRYILDSLGMRGEVQDAMISPLTDLVKISAEKPEDKIDVPPVSLDHFVGRYALAGHPNTAAFEITKKGDVFIFRDLGGPKFEIDLLLRGLGGRSFEMEKGRDNLRFGRPRYRFCVRYDASENRYILDSLGMRGKVQDGFSHPLTDLVKISAEKPGDTFSATLPNDVTVELVGLCEHPSEGKQWWKPDGTLWEDRPYEEFSSHHSMSGEKGYELVWRLRADEDVVYEVESADQGGSGGPAVLHNERGLRPALRNGEFYGVTLFFSPRLSQAAIGIGVGLDRNWKTIASLEGDVSKATSSINNVHLYPAVGADGRTYIDAAYRFPEGKRQAYRIVAVDTSNKQHIMRQGSETKSRGGIHCRRQIDLPLKQIKTIHFQTQPLQRVTFENVSLRPGHKTDAEVEDKASLPGYEVYGTVVDVVPDSWREDCFARLDGAKSEKEFESILKSLEPQPAVGVTVKLQSMLRSKIITEEAVTDEHGKYRFTSLPRAWYGISCEKAVTETRTGQNRMAFAKGGRYRQGIAVPRRQCINLHLRDDYVTVKGRIADANGHPFAGVQVCGITAPVKNDGIGETDEHTAAIRPQIISARSDNDGFYELTGFEPANLVAIMRYLANGSPGYELGHKFYVDVTVGANDNTLKRIPLVTEESLYRARRVFNAYRMLMQRTGGEEVQERQDLPHPFASSHGNTITGIDIVLGQHVSKEQLVHSTDTSRSYDLTKASDFVRKHFDGWKTEVRNNYLLKDHRIKEEHVLKGKTGAVAYVWFATTLENVQTKETKPFEAVYFLYRWHTDQWEGIYNTDGTNTEETQEAMEVYRNKWLPRYLRRVEQGYTRGGGGKRRTPPVQEEEKVSLRPEYSATLANGVTVELVGLFGSVEEDKRPWWRADGAALLKDSFGAYDERVEPMVWDDKPEEQLRYGYVFTVYPSKNVEVISDVSEGTQWHTGFADAKRTTRIGYAYSHTIEQRENFSAVGGIKIAAATGETERFESKVDSGSVEDMYILKGGSNVIVSGPREYRGYDEKMVDVIVTASDIHVEVSYELKNGDVKKADRVSDMGGSSIVSFYGTQRPLHRHSSRVFDPWDQIAKFIVDFRKYELVTFKNVALRPGHKTDVQVEVEKTSQSQFSTTLANGVRVEQPATIRVPEDYPTEFATVKAAKAGDTIVISTDRNRGEDILIEPKLEVEVEETISPKLVMLLGAINSCAAETELNIDSIFITARNIKIAGDTSSRRNTQKFLDAVKKNELEVLQFSFVARDNRDKFRIVVDPKKNLQQWLQRHETDVQLGREENISPKLVMLLGAISSCAAETKLNIESISITAAKIDIKGSTSSRTNTQKFLDAIKKNELEVLRLNYVTRDDRNKFTLVAEPKKNWRQWWQRHKTDIKAEVGEHEGKSRNADILGPALQVLDRKTRSPVPNCSFTFSGSGRVEQTDTRGIYNDPKYNFAGELVSGARKLWLWHPDYETKWLKEYEADKNGTVTVLLEKSGSASLDVTISLTVRGKEINNAGPRLRLLQPDQNRKEVRRIEHSEDNEFSFSGLAAGKYMIEVYFWDSYPTHYQTVELSETEHRKLSIQVKTNQLARFPVRGKVLNKLTGKGIEGAWIHFVGAPDDDAYTYEDGSFSTIADRARFHQCLLMLDADKSQRSRRIDNPVTIDIGHRISEELARNLAIHIDPEYTKSHPRLKLRDENGDGIFCDIVNCTICDSKKHDSLREERKADVPVDVGVKGAASESAKSHRNRYFVMLLVTDGGVIFRGRKLTWDQLEDALKNMPDRGITVLEVAVDPAILPAKLRRGDQARWISDNVEMDRAGELAKELGFEGFSDIGVDRVDRVDRVGPWRGPISVRLEDAFRLGREIPVALESFEARPMISTKSIEFSSTRTIVRATLKVSAMSYPRKSWEIGVRLLDDQGEQIISTVENLRNTGVVISGEAFQTQQEIGFSFAQAGNAVNAARFEVNLREFTTSRAAGKPDVRAKLESPGDRAALMWGEPVNGLRAAVRLVPEKSSYSPGERIEVRFYVENVSERTIQIARIEGQTDPGNWIIEDPNQTRISVGGMRWMGARRLDRRVLKPGQTAVLELEPLTIVESRTSRKGRVQAVVNGPGTYTARYRLNLTPRAEGDWSGALETAQRKFVVTTASRPDQKTAVSVEAERKVGSVVQGKVLGPRGEPVKDATVELQIFVGGDDVYDMTNYRFQRVFTDANGLYVFEGLEAGSAHIGREFTVADGSSSGVPHGLLFDFEIEPGKSYDITLDGKGRPVVGRLVPASGNDGDIDWSKAWVGLELRAAPMGAWKSNAKIVRAMIKDEGGDYYRNGSVKINPDGTFRINNVRAGFYMLRVNVIEEPKRYGYNLVREIRIPLMPDGTSEKVFNLGTLAISYGDHMAPRQIKNSFLDSLEFSKDIPVILKAGNDEQPNVVWATNIRFEKNGESVTAALNIEWKSLVYERWRARLRLLSENGSYLAWHDVFFETSKMIEKYPLLFKETLNFSLGPKLDFSQIPRFTITIQPVSEILTGNEQPGTPAEVEIIPAKEKSDVKVGTERPVIGGWEDVGNPIPADFNDTIALTEQITLRSIGQDVEGKTFITFVWDKEKNRNRQYRFVLVKNNGTILEPDSHLILDENGTLEEKFTFDEPHVSWRSVEFQFQRRPLPLAGNRSISSQLQKNTSTAFEGKTISPSKLAPPGRYAIELDGVDDYLLVPDSPTLRLDPPFTVEMWIKPRLAEQKVDHVQELGVIAQGGYIGTGRVKTRGFGIELIRFEKEPAKFNISYCEASDSGIAGSDYGSYRFDDWIHISHVFEGKSYKPGPGHPLVVGKFLIPVPEPFMGQIGEVRIWNTARKREEIRRYKDVALTGKEPGLAACWTFEQNEGQFAYDISGNNNHARLGKAIEPDGADPKWVDLEAVSRKPDRIADLPVEAESRISRLLAALQNEKYVYIREPVIQMVEEIGDKEPISFLAEQLQSKNRRRRCDAALALELLGDRRGVPAIIKELNDTSYRPTTMIRSDGRQLQEGQLTQDHYYAALLLGILGDERAVQALIEATWDETINYQAAMSLGQIGDKRAVPALRTMLERLNKPFPRLFAGYGLAMLSDEKGLKVVIDTLDNHQLQWTVRRHAIEALGKLADKEAVPHLIFALKDDHPNIRVSAARALGAIGDASALPALEEALKDNTETKINAPTTVNEAAAEAIAQIQTGDGRIADVPVEAEGAGAVSGESLVKPTANEAGPRITFESLVCDLGQVPPKTKHVCEFKFTNTGSDVLKITKVSSTCGCITSKLKKKEYAPGESETLEATFQSSARTERVKKYVFVYSNDKVNPRVILAVKAEVVIKVAHEPKKLNLVLDKKNAGCPAITLTSLDNQPFSITGFKSTGDYITADFDSSVKETSFVLKPKVDMEKLGKGLNGRIEISLNHPECKTLKIVYNTLPEFEFDPRVVYVREAKPLKPVTKKVSVLSNYNEDFEIESTSSKKDIIKVLAKEKVRNGYQFELQITPPEQESKRRVFTDEFTVRLKGGQELKVSCYGIYPKKPAETTEKSTSKTDVLVEARISELKAEKYEGKTIDEWISRWDSELYDDIREATEALTRIGRPAVPAMIEQIKKRSNHGWRAVGVLSKMGPEAEDALELLIEMALDKDLRFGDGRQSPTAYRGSVLYSLSDMKWARQRVITVLQRIAEDGEEEAGVRQQVVWVLRRVGKGAMPILQKLTEDEERSVRDAAHGAIGQLLEKEEGLSKDDYFTPLIEKDPFDPSVLQYLGNTRGMVNYGRPHPLTQKIKKLYRERLAKEPDAQLAWRLATIIQNGLKNTELMWAAPTDGSQGRSPREDPTENYTTLAEVLQLGFDHAESGSQLQRKFGTSLAKLRLLQGDWNRMNAILQKLGQKPIPKESRQLLHAPPVDWQGDLRSQWKIADESMRSGNCSLEFKIEKAGKGLKGVHVLVKRAPEPTNVTYTGISTDTLFFAPTPMKVHFDSFGYKAKDRPMTRYAVSDESGIVRFEKLPNIPIKIEVLVPTSNFPEAVSNWDLWMEVEPGKFKVAKKYGAGAINTQVPPAVVELKEGKTVHYPNLVVRPAFSLNVKDWDHVDKDSFVLSWRGLDSARVNKALRYELEMFLSAPSVKGIPVLQSAKETLEENQWAVGAEGVGGLHLESGNIYVFEVKAIDNSGTAIARWPKTRVWVPWGHRKTDPPCAGYDTIGRPPDIGTMPPLDKQGMWWRGEYTDRDGRKETLNEKVARFLRESSDAFEYEYVRLGKVWLDWHDGDREGARRRLEKLVKELPKGNVARGTTIWLIQQIDENKDPPKRLKFVPDRETSRSKAVSLPDEKTDAQLEVEQSSSESGGDGVVVVSKGKSTMYSSIQEAIDAAPDGSVIRVGAGVYGERPELEVEQSGRGSKPGDGRIVVVSAGKSTMYSSIQEAIDTAPAGSVIRIGPGVYKERLEIDKPLTLEGAGWDQTTIVTENNAADVFEEAMRTARERVHEAKSEEEAKKLSAEFLAQFEAEMKEKMAPQTHLVSDTENVVIRNLKLTSPGRRIEGRALSVPVLKFSNARALVSGCAVVGTPGNGINIEEGSNVEVRDSLVAGVWSTGIAVTSGRDDIATARIINCDVRNCHHRGITIGPGCDSTVVQGCRISGSSWHGIRYDNASPRVIGNLIFANVRCGIYASGETAAVVRQNLFYGNEMTGIACWFKNRDTIEANTFVGNKRSGLEVLGASRPIVQNNIFYANPTGVFCGNIGDDSTSATSDGKVNLKENLFWGFEHKVAWRHPGDAEDEVVTEEVEFDEKTGNVAFDPEFKDITEEDFSLKMDSPALRSGIGAAVLIDSESPWPLQDEEIPIIPDGETEDTSWMGRISSTGKIQRPVIPVANKGGEKPQETIKAKPRVQEGSEHPGRISGVVINSDTGDPIVGAYVGVGDFGDSGGSNYSRHRSQGFHDKTKTDAEGRFELGGLVFTDKHRDLQYHPLVVTHPDFVRHDRKIELPSDGPAPEVKVNLMPAAKIEVTIVDAQGNPLEGQWLIRLEALDGRRFIPPGSDPHLSSFASSVWAQMPNLRAKMGVSNGFTFTELDAGEYSIEAIRFHLVDKPTPQNIWKPILTFHGSIPNIRIQTGQVQQVQLTPQDHQTRLTITPPEFPDKLMNKLERSSYMPLMCLISRSPGAMLWDDGKIHHLEDQRLGRIDKKRFFRGFFPQGKPLTINNLPPDSYSLFAMAVYGQVAGCLIGARADLAKGDKVTLDMPWRQPTGPSTVGPNRSFDYPVKLQARDYSLSELCEILTSITESNPRIIADPSIENEKLSFGKGEMSVWDVLEKLYLDKGWRLGEVPQKALILEPEASSTAKKRRVYLPDLETPHANVILDLATGEMLQAMWLKENKVAKLGKGDVVYEYSGNHSSLLCLRGATMQLRTNVGLSSLKVDSQREYFAGYLLKEVPCQYQVMTAEGDKYELKVISIDKGDTGGAFIQFWKSEKQQTDVPVEVEKGDDKAQIENIINQLWTAIEAKDAKRVKKLAPSKEFIRKDFDINKWILKQAARRAQLIEKENHDISKMEPVAIEGDKAAAVTRTQGEGITYLFKKVGDQWILYEMIFGSLSPVGPAGVIYGWQQTELKREAWAEYLKAGELLHKGTDRAEMAKRFSSIGQRYPLARVSKICSELGILLTEMVAEDKEFIGPGDIESLSADERINYYIFKLRNVAEQEMFVPGKCRILYYPKTPNSAAVALRGMGKTVIPAMIGLVDDRRPTRSVGLAANNAVILRYCDAALEIIEAIAQQKFDRRTHRGAFLSTADNETREQIISLVKAWWEREKKTDVPLEESLDQGRVVHFPADRSLGMLCVQRETIGVPVLWWWGLHNQWQYLRSPWQYLAKARGDVTVPAGKRLGLIVGRDGLKVLKHLAKLRPDDLYMLKIKYGNNAVDKPGDDSMPHLSRLTGLKELILEHPGITNEGLRPIRGLSSLERLSLISRRLDDTGMAHIAELESLKGLRFSSRNVTNAGLSHLSKLTLLEELFPSGIIDDEGLVHLTKLPALRYLRMYSVAGGFTENGLVYLKNIPSLKKLKLGSFGFSGEGLAHISRIPGIEDLTLYNTVLSDEDLIPLKSMNSLKRLSLSSAIQQMAPDFTDEALFHLSQVKSLESLVLGYGKFTDKGLEHLTELDNLKHLDIPNNSGFTDAGLSHLTKVPLLEELKLRANQFTDVGMSSIAKLTNLKRLELWGHRAKITDKGLVHLADMSKLSYLVIKGNFIDEGLAHVGNLDKLSYLDISGDFTDEELHHLEGLDLLKQLKISSTSKLSPQALQELRGKLPNLLVLN